MSYNIEVTYGPSLSLVLRDQLIKLHQEGNEITTKLLAKSIIEKFELELTTKEIKKLRIRIKIKLSNLVKSGLVDSIDSWNEKKIYYKIYKPKFNPKKIC